MLAHPESAEICTPVVFGDAAVLRACAKKAELPFDAPVLSPDEWARDFASIARPAVVDFRVIGLDAFTPGTISAATGHAGFTYVNHAIDAALAGQVAAVSTAPLNREAMSMAGIHFPGHTEIFAARTGATRWCEFTPLALQFTASPKL